MRFPSMPAKDLLSYVVVPLLTIGAVYYLINDDSWIDAVNQQLLTGPKPFHWSNPN